VTFWCGSRSADPYLWQTDPDPTPDPTPSFSDYRYWLRRKEVGWILVLFDWSRVKLFTLKFSNESVQATSYERPKSAQRTFFLSFEINNCFSLTVYCRRLMKKSGKLVWGVLNSNIAIHSLPTLQYRYWKDLWWIADSHRLLKYRGWCTLPLVS
jgi:hypothetical protein